MFCPVVPYVPDTKLIGLLGQLGMTTGLKLCLDAGDSDSYSSGQKWLDRSGGGYDFFLGTSSGSDSTDPTFSGAAGGQSASEYWSFDGGDYFTYDATNESWMDNIHKNSAKFAICGWVYLTGFSPRVRLCGDIILNATEPGFGIEFTSTGALRLSVLRPTNTSVLSVSSTATANTDEWTFFAVQADEAAGTGILQIGGTQESVTTTYSSPSASVAGVSLEVARGGSGAAQPPPNGSRLSSFAAWEGSIPSASDLLALYSASRSKFF